MSRGIGHIFGIGLTGQMHGLAMLDAQNKVIRPAIIWCDQRTALECKQIRVHILICGTHGILTIMVEFTAFISNCIRAKTGI